MALSSGTVWEVRFEGSQNNGGGYTSGGTDYSQQDAAQANPTDLSHAAGSSTLTAVADVFTAAMVGNIIHITSGTNFTVGWYEIITYTNPKNVIVDRSLGASANVTNNGVGYIGGAFKLGGALDTSFASTVVSNNTVWIKKGTYTSVLIMTFPTGGAAATPIKIKGYLSARADACIDADRPSLSFTTNGLTTGAFNSIENVIIIAATSSLNSAALTLSSSYAKAVNCSIANTTADAQRNGVITGLTNSMIGCEVTTASTTVSAGNGSAIFAGGPLQLIGCYIHDSIAAVNCAASTTIYNSVIDTCTTGIVIGANNNTVILSSTVYGCTTGISIAAGLDFVIYNNIISGNTTGLSRTVVGGANRFSIGYNVWFNATDVSDIAGLIPIPSGALAVNPDMVGPAGGDFTILATSNAAGSALDASTYTSATV